MIQNRTNIIILLYLFLNISLLKINFPPLSYIIVVEHDLAVLDYLSDYICLLYGFPGAYGVVTHPSGVREGINQFLDGFIASENMRFRYHFYFKIIINLI